MKKAQHYSSHLPVLWHALEHTQGTVLELGVGLFSTPFLHYFCVPRRRLVVSVDSNEKYYQSVLSFSHEFHKIVLDPDWSLTFDLDDLDVVFIDNAPPEQRRVDLLKYVHRARYIIVHDTNGRHDRFYNLRKLWPRFKHVRHYGTFFPQTTIVSNFEMIGEIC